MDDSLFNSDIEQSQIVLLGIPYDETSSSGKGANRAPKEIFDLMGENNQLEHFERYTMTTPTDFLNIASHIIDVDGKTPEDMVKIAADNFSSLYAKGKHIICVGGEHSITNGPLYSLAKLKNPKDITVLQIDAHMDLRPDDSDYNGNDTWGKFAHSAVMRRAFELDYGIVQVGVRAYHGTLEYSFAKKNNIRFFEWGKAFQDPSIEDIVNAIKTDDVYLTIDVDGLDPSVMPSTGTPVIDGLQWRYCIQLLDKLYERKNIISADIVEVIPKPIPDITAYNAAQLIYYMIALKHRPI